MPARIAELSDIEVLECQPIENGQREACIRWKKSLAFKAMLEVDLPVGSFCRTSTGPFFIEICPTLAQEQAEGKSIRIFA